MKKVLGIFAAMNSVGLGIALFLQCGLGGDSVAVFCEGLQVALEIRFGHASLIFNLVMILISWIVSRKNIGMGTMVYALGYEETKVDCLAIAIGTFMESFTVNRGLIIRD